MGKPTARRDSRSHLSTTDKSGGSVDLRRRKRNGRRSAHRSPGVRLATLGMIAMLAFLTVLLSGCLILGNGTSGGSDGPSSTGSGTSGAGGGTSSTGSTGSGKSTSTSTSSEAVGDPSAGDCPLPPPDVWWRIPPTLTADQQVRQREVCLYTAGAYQMRGFKIVATKQGRESGTIVDYMDENSVPGADATPPDPPPPEAMVLPDGVQRQLMESEVYPEMQGPPSSIPIVRRDFWDYVSGDSGASSLEDWLSSNQVLGKVTVKKDDKLGVKHAGYVFQGPPPLPNQPQVLPNQGANVNINAFGGGVEPGSFSLHEMVVGCRVSDPKSVNFREMWQMIGIASSRDSLNYPSRFPDYTLTGDNVLRLEVEFLTNGHFPEGVGDGKGGWFSAKKGFIPLMGAPYAPGSAFAAATISTVDGPQFESLFQIKIDSKGDWWVGHNGNWLGRYPASLFKKAPFSMLETHACEMDVYGEVTANLTDISFNNELWTWTPMGSGQPAAAGFGKASYFRDPSYVSNDVSGQWLFPNPNDAQIPDDYAPKCYSSTSIMTGPSPWDLYFYVGGKGIITGCN